MKKLLFIAMLFCLLLVPIYAADEPATTIIVDVDLSELDASISGLSADILALNSAVESMAEAQESLLVECNDLQKASVKSTDSAAVAILIFIGIILSFSITLWLFRK